MSYRNGTKSNKSTYSVLLILSGITLVPVSSIQGTLAFDKKKDMVYSKGAPKNFNQKKYNDLFVEICESAQPYGFFNLPPERIVAIFYMLQLDGSPEALRLKSDLEEVIKMAKKDLKKLLQF